VTHLEISHRDGIATLTLRRGKVNALNAALVAELHEAFARLEGEGATRALILTGRGKFFSFGLDVPELYPLPPEAFARFLGDFTDLYTRVYGFPKPVLAAVNGHAIAGGCMLALACDRRLMVEERARIGLNEISFGSSVFAGSVEMLRALVGQARAEQLLISGAMHPAEAARELGLVDRVVPAEDLLPAAIAEARELAERSRAAYGHLKRMLRGPVLEEMRRREAESIREFVGVWYSEATREQLRRIQIRS
jgi:enoyl-CoA hydratase/carnithine racemase